MRCRPRIIVLPLLGLLLASSALDARDGPPNIVLFLADDLGYAELGCYGQEHFRTPSIDRLAAQGIRFTQHYAGQAVCAPSRCVLLTGKHTGHADIRNNREVKPEGQLPLSEGETTIAEVLKTKGYATAAIGKWGLGMPETTGDPNRRGFDLFYGFNCQRHAHNHYPRYLWRNDERETLEGNDRTLSGEQYSQDLFTREAMRFVRESADRPFFLYVPFAIPHLSIQVPEESLAEYRGEIPEEDYEHRGYLEHPHPRAGYAAMITHMDRDIGRIVDLIDELGLAEDTIIAFSSDNGPTFDRLGGSDSDFFESSGPLRGRKGQLLEGGIRVPLVVRWSGHIEAGRTTDHISAFQDWMPTICDIVGAEPPDLVDGVGFLPTLTGQGEQPTHEYLYWEFPAYGGQQAARFGRWKALRRGLLSGPRADRAPDLTIGLYDLETDIAESRDVADEHPDVVRRAREIFRTARVPSARFPFPALER